MPPCPWYDERMPRVNFDELPGHARLWVFAAERELSTEERARFLATVDTFLDNWQAHRHPLVSARDFRYDRFLLVAADEQAAGVSGCSIDALVREIKQLEGALGVRLVDHGPVLFRDGGRVVRVPRDEFATLARDGRVTPQTPVFDNTVTRVEDVRSGRWEGPASGSWHGRAFF
jgi:hypothetical protein